MTLKPKGLTLTVVCNAQSANFGEGLGNVAVLKKMIASDGLPHTYISRQALRYSMLHAINFDTTPVHVDKTVAQFDPETTIETSPEIDLFGYMKTQKGTDGRKRSAVVRLSHALSTEPFYDEMDFLTNLGLYNRLPKSDTKQKGLMPSQSEMHNSLYVYTLTIDLEKVGLDTTDDIEVSPQEKAKRVNCLLNAIQHLYRDIRGRREDMQPLLIVGGIYDIKSPIFANALDIQKREINVDRLFDYYDDVADESSIAIRKGEFVNEQELINTLPIIRVSEMINNLKTRVSEYYSTNE